MNELTFRDELTLSPIDVPRAALRFAQAIAFPDLDIASYLLQLKQLSEVALDFIAPSLTPAEQAQALSDFLFVRQKFQGNSSDYTDPRNSYLNEVLDRRLGIPISLSVIYVAVAEKLGILAQGIGLPGHFIVSVRDPRGEIYIDPFHGGTRLDQADCAQLVEASTGFRGPFNPEWLKPVTPEATLTRMLNNLRNAYFQIENWAQARKVIEHLRILQPELPDLLRDLGFVHQHSGSLRLAIRFYENYLQRSPHAPDAEAVKGYLRAAAQQLARLN